MWLKGGKCYTNAALIVGCDCPCQFQGAQCETATNFCSDNLCLNGFCNPNPTACGYQCVCNVGYLGKYCETPINACFNIFNNSIPNCLNGASCVDLHYTYQCKCTPGFTGSNCQTPKNTCTPNNCKNGAICTALTNDYVCACPCPFYSGKNCDVNYSFSKSITNNLNLKFYSSKFYTDICKVRGSECLNGGVCISNGCSFSCSCPFNYTGFRCEQPADPCSYNTCNKYFIFIKMNSFLIT